MSSSKNKITEWIQLKTEDGKVYYFNQRAQITQWEIPDGYCIDTNIIKESNPRDVVDAWKNTEPLNSRLSVTSVEEAFSFNDTLASPKMDISGKKARTIVWEKKSTATFGNDASSECYYYNVETGETQWDRPDDYESEEEFERNNDFETMTFHIDTPVGDILDSLGYFESGTLVRDCNAMLKSGIDADGKCENRLVQTKLAIKYTGTLSEWEEWVTMKHYQIVKLIMMHWNKEIPSKTPMRVRQEACILIELFLKLKPAMIKDLIDEETGGYNIVPFTANLERGLEDSKGDETATSSWLYIYYVLFSELSQIPKNVIPSGAVIFSIVHNIEAEDQDLFITASLCIIAVNFHMGLANEVDKLYDAPAKNDNLNPYQMHVPNTVVLALLASPRAEIYFAEAIMRFLNEQRCPYSNEKLLRQLLYMILALFANTKSANFFLVNDLKILIDIILSQLDDLPSSDPFRVEYLRILYDILKNSTQWSSGTERYRHTKIAEHLHVVVGAENHGMHPVACAYAKRILSECANELN